MQFPAGYYTFHKAPFINYQLNRWYSFGYARREDIEEIGAGIRSFEDYVQAFSRAAEGAVRENRLKHAATYYRAAEFLIDPGAPEKIPAYERFRQTFEEAFAGEPYERHLVPYAGRFLSAMRLPAQGEPSKGTILACGGFDSFIEEFYSIWRFFTEKGYEVIAFEGPGQGATLRKHQLPFEHDWEKPTAAVLDFYDRSDVTMIGISMGGYWAVRAAAFEERISRVIAFPPVYDWLEMTNAFNRWLVGKLMNYEKLMNFLARQKMSIPKLRHTIRHGLFITRQSEPIDAVRWMLGMNKEHIQSNRVKQDVLLLGGENDAFQPPVLLQKQKAALVHARSVETRIFTRAEQAGRHCQAGNVQLALDTMLDWMQRKEKNRIKDKLT